MFFFNRKPPSCPFLLRYSRAICCCLLLLLSILEESYAYEPFFPYASLSSVNNNPHTISNDINLQLIDGYYRHPPGIINITTLIGKTIYFNCTLNNEDEQNLVKYTSSFGFKSKLNPTWLKADPLYASNGYISGYKSESIIVTRKGIIVDAYRDKLRLISSSSDQFQTLQIANVNVNNEGKYICREFNSQYDKLYYLNVLGK